MNRPSFPKPSKLSAEFVRGLLDYCPETGEMLWKRPLARALKPGDKAGWNSQGGYLRLRIANEVHQVHRIAWLIFYGEWPESEVDHINGLRSDNRIVNLRLATDAQNAQNQKLRFDNTTGFTGVSFDKNLRKYKARIGVNWKRIELGYFETAEEAASAYASAKERLHPFQPEQRLSK